MTESIAVDGYVLDDLLCAHGVQGNSGLFTVAAKRGSNVTVAGRDGAVHVPRKRHEQGVVVLPLWARGVDSAGHLPDGEAAQRACIARVRELTKRFTVGDLVTIRHTLTDGTAREIAGEVTDSIDWTNRGHGRDTLGQATVALTCADPFWVDLDVTTAVVASGPPQLLPEFAAASARMVDLVVTFGPSSNPAITQPSGVVLGYNGLIAAGRTLEIDAGAYTAVGRVDGGGTWVQDTDPTQHIRRVRHEGDPALWILDPEIPAPTAQLTHTGGGVATATITGRMRYKTA